MQIIRPQRTWRGDSLRWERWRTPDRTGHRDKPHARPLSFWAERKRSRKISFSAESRRLRIRSQRDGGWRDSEIGKLDMTKSFQAP